jgi:hypothetical protein
VIIWVGKSNYKEILERVFCQQLYKRLWRAI